MKIAVQGCAHGELEIIYDTIEYIEKKNNITIDLLLCCGDFQASRNLEDLQSMAVPQKHRNLCSFYKYYSGEKTAPKLTVFIGGNHEASNYLQELPYGGWVAPNIYYLGYAGVVNVAGVRIAGLSGIYKGRDFSKGRYEKPPYNETTLRTVYHIRNLDVFRLKQLTSPVHIILSHEWPTGVTNHGNVEKLLKTKPFLKEDILNETLGNNPSTELMECLKPDYWFAAHLHVKFAALIKHGDKATKFLALDKCLPRRKFLQIVEVPHETGKEIRLEYDAQWLAVLQLTNHLTSVSKLNAYLPGPGSKERWMFTPTEEEVQKVTDKFGDLVIEKNFAPTAPAHGQDSKAAEKSREIRFNPQTLVFCERLCVDDPMALLLKEEGFHDDSSFNMSTFESSTFINSSELNTPSPDERKSFTRTPLKLPKPCFANPDTLDDGLITSTPIEKTGVPDLEATPTLRLAEGDVGSSDPETRKEDDLGVSGPKKFRRRNIALYESTEDD